MDAMRWPALVTLGIALLLFMVAINVGRQRGRYKIGPPHTTGHPMLERAFRVQMNTLENAVLVLPLMWICALFLSPPWAAVGGALWLVARIVYALGYMRDPERRLLGFGLSMLMVTVLFCASLWGVLKTWL